MTPSPGPGIDLGDATESQLRALLAAALNAGWVPGDPFPGGGGVGSPVVRKFPFTHSTAGILTGAALYTPTVGDVLLDARLSILTAWDGTTPKADIGQFAGGATVGWFGDGIAPIDMTVADIDVSGGSPTQGLLIGQRLTLAQATMINVVTSGGVLTVSGASINPGTTPTNGSTGVGVFTSANPIKVCVSQDGTASGADPGSTQGAGVLYLITATPV